MSEADDDAGRDNQAGWALLSTPGAGHDALEAAVACFRRSIQRTPALPQAAANLGNALVALGREADAITELEGLAAGETAIAATAHNWLGWRCAGTDRDRALQHLREATRLRPAWGVAWHNLARVLDAAGDISAACLAYGEAITRGDAHDDALARDRRLQLEMQLLGRGEPVPAVPDEVRADSAAFAIVRATAGRLATPRVFMVRPTTRDVAYALIGTVVDGRALGHVIVGGVGAWLSAFTLAAGDGTVVFETTRAGAEHADRSAAPLLAWLAAMDPAAVTPIDAAMWLRDVVVAALPGGWRWELASYRPAGLVVTDAAGEIRLVATARAGGGLEIALPAIGAGAASQMLNVDTPAQLLELATPIQDATRRALAARDEFAARPFGIRLVAAELTRALGLAAPQISERYPAWPTVWLFDAAERFTVLHLAESATGFDIAVHHKRFAAATPDELAAVMPAVATAVAADRGRLRVGRIQPRDRFRVLTAFGGFSPGSEVELERIATISREGDRAYFFVGAGSTQLAELNDADAAILADLDRYLAAL